MNSVQNPTEFVDIQLDPSSKSFPVTPIIRKVSKLIRTNIKFYLRICPHYEKRKPNAEGGRLIKINVLFLAGYSSFGQGKSDGFLCPYIAFFLSWLFRPEADINQNPVPREAVLPGRVFNIAFKGCQPGSIYNMP